MKKNLGILLLLGGAIGLYFYMKRKKNQASEIIDPALPSTEQGSNVANQNQGGIDFSAIPTNQGGVNDELAPLDELAFMTQIDQENAPKFDTSGMTY